MERRDFLRIIVRGNFNSEKCRHGDCATAAVGLRGAVMTVSCVAFDLKRAVPAGLPKLFNIQASRSLVVRPRTDGLLQLPINEGQNTRSSSSACEESPDVTTLERVDSDQ